MSNIQSVAFPSPEPCGHWVILLQREFDQPLAMCNDCVKIFLLKGHV